MSTPSDLIRRDPQVLGGTPVFRGTRVPVRILIEFLSAGDSLEEFLDAYPSVSREQAVGVLELASSLLLNGASAA